MGSRTLRQFHPGRGCLLIAAAVLLQTDPGLPQSHERGVQVSTKPPEVALKELYGKSWAVVVGINKYPTGGRKFHDLQYAVSDARRVSAKLHELGFEVRTLVDEHATRANIKGVLADDIGAKAKPDDRIVFFFAGHGDTRVRANREPMGYILPYDFKESEPSASSISMNELKVISQEIQAKHMLYVMDSCFSGGLIEGVRGGTMPAGQGFEALKNMTQSRAHMVITAGRANETAKEQGGSGIFTKFFLEALSSVHEKPWARDGYVTATELASWIKKRVPVEVSDQNPQSGYLDGEGEVILALFKPVTYEHVAPMPNATDRMNKELQEQIEQMKKDKERALRDKQQAEAEKQQAERDRQRAEADRLQAEQDRQQAERDRQQALQDKLRAIEEGINTAPKRKQRETIVPPSF